MASKTILHHIHVQSGAKMTEFGGWEMPLSYPTGQIAEHAATRTGAGLFDISHMGRLWISGPDAAVFLNTILTANAKGLRERRAMYALICNASGGVIDDVFLYRFTPERYMLVVNASNAAADIAHIEKLRSGFDVTIHDASHNLAMLSLQGPDSRRILQEVCEEIDLEPFRNAAGEVRLFEENGYAARTGYTGEPIGFELFLPTELAEKAWEVFVEAGATPCGLAARDTLRIEAGMPLYGHEYGTDSAGEQIPAYAFPLAKSAVSFSESKGPYLGRQALKEQYEAYKRIENKDFSDIRSLPKHFVLFALTAKGIARSGDKLYAGGQVVGEVSSGTMAPYRIVEGEGPLAAVSEETRMRSIGIAYVDSSISWDTIAEIEIEIRGRRTPGLIVENHLRSDAPPYARPILAGYGHAEAVSASEGYSLRASSLITEALHNDEWRQKETINLIPSEMTASNAVRMLSGLDPSFRYAEHRKLKSFYGAEVFYYQGTGFIHKVEELLKSELAAYLGASCVEARALSGQMANTIAYSALVSYKNRTYRKEEPARLGYVINNHLNYGGHLSAQPMGALRDYLAYDPDTDARALANIPVLADNPYRADSEALKALIDETKPDLIIFGKSMVLEKEPVAEIAGFLKAEGLQTTILYDMAHVFGLYGEHFQAPLAEGAHLVTASTHKSFFGTQRGIVAGNYEDGDSFWEEVESRAFPGATSNHHLGTMLGLLMACYEMNAFKEEYQKAVIANAKAFAAALAASGVAVEGDSAIGYTETHQVVINVGYAKAMAAAQLLEDNNIIANYQSGAAL